MKKIVLGLLFGVMVVPALPVAAQQSHGRSDSRHDDERRGNGQERRDRFEAVFQVDRDGGFERDQRESAEAERALEGVGVFAATSCEEGICGTCSIVFFTSSGSR